MPRGKYLSCFQGDHDEDADGTDVNYTRLDGSKSKKKSVSKSRQEGDNVVDENDYFRSADSYQWNRADLDQGEEPLERFEDQGSTNYSGVQVQSGQTGNKRPKPKGIRAHVRHAIHSSWKWIKRGFIFVAPSLTASLSLNPSTTYITAAKAIYSTVPGKGKAPVSL